MTNHRRTKSSLKTGASFVALSFALAVSSAASSASLPDHGHYVSGQGSINKANRSLTVKQSSTTGIINWKSFSVGAKNGVTFDNGSGATLNRVTGGNLSRIAGSLHATGSLYLINSQGVIVSGTGRVVTGGNFVVSTGSITNNAFDDGHRKFRQRRGDIVNRGSITAGGNVRLSARNVRNNGSAAGSNVALHAAHDLDIGGSVAARHTSGGIVIATGEHIAIAGTADISANGRRGGTVLIGGDIHGGAVGSENFVHRHVRDAETTKIAKGATISANASHGAGGDIVIWSDGHTSFNGSVSAKGRTDGGFAEISSKKLLGFKGGVDLLAKHGQTGTLLLDPEDVVISDGTTANGSISGGTFTPNGDDSVLNVSDLQNALASANVDVVTGSSGSQTGDITVLDPVTWSSAGTLKLDAYHSIYIDATIAITGTGGLVLTTNDGGSGGDYYFNGGNVVFSDVVSGNTQGSLIINGTTYELVNSVSQLASDVSVDAYNFYALANSYDAGVDGTYSSSPVGILFHGTFEGLGNTISNLTVDDTTDADVGLFAEIDASGALRDIGLVGGSISGSAISAQIGDLVGYNDGGTITRDYATGAVTGGANAIVGGLVGANSGSISQSYTTGAVSGGGDSGIGGLVGSSNGAISQSYATGAVTDTAIGIDAGGLVGANSGSISQSYATGAVTGGNISPVGGLVGVSNGTITQSYATGTVTAGEHAYVGGLVGQNSGTLTASYATGAVTGGEYAYVGGLVGQNYSGTISHSYTTGAVTGGTSAYVGGFVGQNDANATIDESYSTGTATGLGGATVGDFAGENENTDGISASVGDYYNNTANAGAGVGWDAGTSDVHGLALSNMRTASSFSEWTDFGTTGGGSGWVIVDVESSLNNDGGTTGATTPMLLSEYSTNIASAHQLQLMALDVTANYTLNNDIDAGGTGSGTDVWGSSTGFVPIGNLGIEFTGTFNGHGHTISGLTIDDSVSDSVGLFAVADNATIENVGLVGGSITATTSTGADTGALAGDVLDASTFSNVYSTANVTGNEDVGGLIGNLQDTATIAGSYATGAVTLTSGGVDGGGLVGTAGIHSAISDSYATGAVSGGDNMNLGGLVGGVGNGVSISDSYAAGAVTGGNGANVGGLVGQGASATYTDTYWDTDTSGIGVHDGVGNFTDKSNVTGLTTAALSSALPGGFSSSVWGNVSNQTTPYLLALTSNPQTVYIGADSTTAPFSLLFNVDQVQAINNNLSANYALANDIDASATSGWNSGAGFKPLGNYSGDFSGVFDGLGNTVSNLMIDDSTDTNVGLFGYVTGTISNVSVSGSVSGSAADANVGGIVGFLFYGTVSNAHSAIAVSDTGATSGQGAGGLVGFNDFGTITQSSATGNVSMNGNDVAAGGLVGVNGGPISQSFASGNVTMTDSAPNDGSANSGGGLVGSNDEATISDSYAFGNVSVDGDGGLAGGFAGENINGGTIQDAYSLGSASADSRGGFVGYEDSSTITHSYWDTQTSGLSSSHGVGLNDDSVDLTGKTTSALEAGLLTGFDGATWGIVAGTSLPYLSWQFSGTPQVVSGIELAGVGGSGISGATVSLMQNGANLNSALTGGSVVTYANGFYYFLLSPGSIQSSSNPGLIVYNSSHHAEAFADQASDSVTGLDLTENYLLETTSQGTLSAVNADLLSADGGTNPVTAPNLEIDAASDFTIDSAMNDSGDTVIISASGGSVNQTVLGQIVASKLLLEGSADFTLENASNAVTTLAMDGSQSLDFKDSHALTIGTVANVKGVDAGGGIDITTTSGGIAITQQLGNGSHPVTLASASGITESGSGFIDATALSGSSQGAVSLKGSNIITDLDAFSTGGNTFELEDDRDLKTTGTVNAGSQEIELITTGSGHDIDVDSKLEGSEVKLVSAATIGEGSSGLIDTAKLAGSSVGSAEMKSSSNDIIELGTFTSGSTFELVDDHDLTTTGTVNAGSHTIELTTKGSGHDIKINSKVEGSEVKLVSAATVTESSSGIVDAATLTGSSVGSAEMTNAGNDITDLGTFTSGSTFELVDDRDLKTTGTVNAGAHEIELTTTGSGHDIDVDSKLEGSEVKLVSAATISEGSSGLIDAAELAGSSVGSAEMTNASNDITDLGTFTSGSTFELVDDHDLTTTGTVNAGSHTIALTTKGSGHDIKIDSKLEASELKLVSAATISESGSGAIEAKTLTGSSVGSAQMTGSKNAITDLGAFTSGSAFELADDHALTTTGTVNAGSHTIALTTTGSGHDIAIASTLEGKTVDLNAAGAATETSKGAIVASLLNVTASTGIDLTSKANKIKKVGTDKTKTGPNKVTL